MAREIAAWHAFGMTRPHRVRRTYDHRLRDAMVLPPTNVVQAARGSRWAGVGGGLHDSAHVIGSIVINKDGGVHTNTSRKESRRYLRLGR